MYLHATSSVRGPGSLGIASVSWQSSLCRAPRLWCWRAPQSGTRALVMAYSAAMVVPNSSKYGLLSWSVTTRTPGSARRVSQKCLPYICGVVSDAAPRRIQWWCTFGSETSSHCRRYNGFTNQYGRFSFDPLRTCVSV